MTQHIFTGAGAPSSTPTALGQHYIDTTNDDSYISVGTASSADWQLTAGGGGTTYTFSDSLNEYGGTVTLDNDSAAPGYSKYYGTNSGGTKGWYDLPTGGGSQTPWTSNINAAGYLITDNSNNESVDPSNRYLYSSGAYNAQVFNWDYYPTSLTQFQMQQIYTPDGYHHPASGYNFLYFKSDNNLYMMDAAGTETQVNGGGGSSGWTAGGMSGEYLYTTYTDASVVIGTTSSDGHTLLEVESSMGPYGYYDIAKFRNGGGSEAKFNGNNDLEFMNNSIGVILIDRTTAYRYRLYVDSGALAIESV